MVALHERVRRKVGIAWGRLTWSMRSLPDFIIIGAPKCGTTALYYHLTRHPRVRPARFKEVHYFDRHYGRGERWYRSHFPRAEPAAICGESTPDYFAAPGVPARVARTLPDVRLMALLRDPADRACSHYHHDQRRGRERGSFEDALERALRADARPAWLRDGLYATHLANWLRAFPRERLLVLRSEDYFACPSFVERVVLPFLGLPSHPMGHAPACNVAHYPALSDAARLRLARFYASENARLKGVFGNDLRW